MTDVCFLHEMFDIKGHNHDPIRVCVLFTLRVCSDPQDIYKDPLSVRWDDIIGLEEAKQLVKEALVYPIKVC